MKSVLWLVVTLGFCAALARSPASFKKCQRKRPDFDDCLREAVVDAMTQMVKPFKEAGLPSLEPMEVPSLVIGAGGGPTAFVQNYHDLKIYGLSHINCTNVKMDFEKKTLHLTCWTPECKLVFSYEIDGKILLLPIKGRGPGNLILRNLSADATFDLEEFTKNDKKHFKVNRSSFVLTPDRIIFDLKNLFNGDQSLSDSVLQVLNDNWKEVFADVKGGYEDAFAQIFKGLLNNMMAKLSVEELFGDE